RPTNARRCVAWGTYMRYTRQRLANGEFSGVEHARRKEAKEDARRQRPRRDTGCLGHDFGPHRRRPRLQRALHDGLWRVRHLGPARCWFGELYRNGGVRPADLREHHHAPDLRRRGSAVSSMLSARFAATSALAAAIQIEDQVFPKLRAYTKPPGGPNR